MVFRESHVRDTALAFRESRDIRFVFHESRDTRFAFRDYNLVSKHVRRLVRSYQRLRDAKAWASRELGTSVL